MIYEGFTDNNYLTAGPWTVFAPTNSAFMNLPMKVLLCFLTYFLAESTNVTEQQN